MEYISCIKDGKTGECRDLKDKQAHEKIEELTAKTNEIVETVNNMTGASVSQDAFDNDNKGVAVGGNASANNYAVAVGSGDSVGFTEASNHGVAIGHTADAGTYGVAVGKNAKTQNSSGTDVMNGTAVGYGTRADAYGVAIGSLAKAQAEGAVQIGEGTNTKVNSLQVYNDNIYDSDKHTLTVQNIELNGEDLATKIANAGEGTSGGATHTRYTDITSLYNAVKNCIDNNKRCGLIVKFNSQIISKKGPTLTINCSTGAVSYNSLTENTTLVSGGTWKMGDFNSCTSSTSFTCHCGGNDKIGVTNKALTLNGYNMTIFTTSYYEIYKISVVDITSRMTSDEVYLVEY